MAYAAFRNRILVKSIPMSDSVAIKIPTQNHPPVAITIEAIKGGNQEL